MGATDPQIEIAEDRASAIASGTSAETLADSLPAIDIAESIAPFVTIFDDTGKAIASSATLHGKPLSLPAGVLDFTRAHGEERVTWQPEPDVRIAAVVVRSEGKNPGFVLSGRSLREPEKRTALLTLQVGLAWLTTMIASLSATTFVGIFKYR